MNEHIPRWNCSLHVVEETFSIVNCGIFKSDEIETGFSFWLQYSCNSLVVFETEIYHKKLYHFTILTCKDEKMAVQNFIFRQYLHDAICIPQICLSNGYRESSIMHENFNLNLQGKCRNISIYQLYTYIYKLF